MGRGERMKEFEVTGVLEYAHAFSKCVKANTKEEAKKMVEDMFDDMADSQHAEFTDGKVDEVEDCSQNVQIANKGGNL